VFDYNFGKAWESGNSWANTYQICKKNVYPYKQKELEKGTGI
jgi:hypothetical protein